MFTRASVETRAINELQYVKKKAISPRLKCMEHFSVCFADCIFLFVNENYWPEITLSVISDGGPFMIAKRLLRFV